VQLIFYQNLIFFCFKLIFFCVFKSFGCADIKINFKNKKKHYFDVFPSEKHFEKQPSTMLSNTLLL